MTTKGYVYARKSEESDEKQVQSVQDQINYWKRYAENTGIEIVEIFKEDKSARKPHIRTEFYRMLKQVDKSDVKIILAWKLDRLTRNPIDTGEIQYRLQNGSLNKIITSDREYLPVDAGLLFSVETGMATQFILDLSKNVKRGMDGKIERGGWIGPAPLGYLNDKGDKTIIVDPERFDLIRKAWDLMLTGTYTPPKIVDIMNNEWGMRMRSTPKRPGGQIQRSMIYALFHNIFYTGKLDYKGDICEGLHKPMVTMAEFQRVQELLGKRGNPRAKTYDFAYNGIIRCSSCGCSVTAENRFKYSKASGTTKYIYYHCTHSKDSEEFHCSERDNINEELLEKQITDTLASMTIHPKFIEWSIGVLKDNHDTEIREREEMQKSINRNLVAEQGKLDRLTKLLLNDTISEEEYKKEKTELQYSIENLKEKAGKSVDRAIEWNELTERTYRFATYAYEHFNSGDLQKKRELFRALGQDFILRNGKIEFNLYPWFVPFAQISSKNSPNSDTFEPSKKGISMRNTNTLSALCPKWLPQDTFLRTILKVSPLFRLLPEGYRFVHSWQEEMKRMRAGRNEGVKESKVLAL